MNKYGQRQLNLRSINDLLFPHVSWSHFWRYLSQYNKLDSIILKKRLIDNKKNIFDKLVFIIKISAILVRPLMHYKKKKNHNKLMVSWLTLYGQNSFFRRFSGHNKIGSFRHRRDAHRTFFWWSLLKIELKFR